MTISNNSINWDSIIKTKRWQIFFIANTKTFPSLNCKQWNAMPWNKNENVSIKWFNFVQAREKEKEQKNYSNSSSSLRLVKFPTKKVYFIGGSEKFPLVVDMRGDVVWVFLLTDKLEFKKISCDLQMLVPTFCHLRVCLFSLKCTR